MASVGFAVQDFDGFKGTAVQNWFEDSGRFPTWTQTLDNPRTTLERTWSLYRLHRYPLRIR